MNVAELLVRCLQAEGVREVYTLPGEENLALLDALHDTDLAITLTRHEQAAGFMAATVGRLTDRVAVCVATLGPGATNLATAVAYAQLGGMPVLFITGQKPARDNRQGGFQMVDVVRLMEPITKLSRRVPDDASVPALVRHAIRVARDPKPGPVLLELPQDLANQATDARPLSDAFRDTPRASDAALDRAAQALNQANAPLLVVSTGCRGADCDALAAFVEKSGLHFFSTQMGKGALDERHPRSLGAAAASEGEPVHDAVAAADVVLFVGHDVSEKPPFLADPQTTLIHLAAQPATLDPVYTPHIEVVGEICASLYALTERVDARDPLSTFEAVKQRIEAEVFAAPDPATEAPLDPRQIVAALREGIPSEGVLCLDNGLYKLAVARHFRAHHPHSVLLDNALASMGAGLPSAIAARQIHPDRPVVALCGDGGYLMNGQSLETAVRLGLDLTVVVLRDDAYGMIKWKQQSEDRAARGLDFGNPDFVKHAESFGAAGARVSSSKSLVEALRHAQGAGGIHVIEVPLRYPEG